MIKKKKKMNKFKLAFISIQKKTDSSDSSFKSLTGLTNL